MSKTSNYHKRLMKTITKIHLKGPVYSSWKRATRFSKYSTIDVVTRRSAIVFSVLMSSSPYYGPT